MSASLGRQAARGVITTGSGQVIRVALQILSVVVLARLISPSEYGLFAMVTAVVGVGEIVREMGLSTAAIQAKDLTRAQRDNLFWISTAAGLLVGCVVAIASPLLVVVYQRPEVLAICLALAPTFLVSGMTAQFRASLVRGMRFKALAVTEVSCAALALLIGIIAAAHGMGYWALVIQAQVGGVASLAMMAVVARWRPRAYDRSAPMRALVRMGSSILGSQVITYTSINIDSMLVGSVYGARDLGFYNRGMQLVRTPLNQLRAPIGTVALPVLSRLQNDPKRFMEFVSNAQLAVGYPLLAGIGWFIACGEHAVRVALGPTWVEATPVIQLIAASEGLSTLIFMASWMYISLGLGRDLMRFSAFTLVLRLILMLAALPLGIVAIAAVGVVGAPIVLPIALWQVARASGFPTGQLFSQACSLLTVIVCVSGVTALAVHEMSTLPGPVILLAAAAIQVAGLAIASLLPPIRRQMMRIWSLMGYLRATAVAPS